MSEIYKKSIEYLESLIDYEKTRPPAYTEQDYDIEGFKKLLITLGNPQNKFKSVHVAGTKGKGSTSSFIEMMLRKSGFKTGLYTSPHIVDYPERIKINGEEIDRELLADYIFKTGEMNKAARDGSGHFFRTVFEILTGIAFQHFANEKVDFAVIETGLGGRLDCTNAITPEISVITSIGLDHIAVLGDTLDKIAFEKAGIIKSEKQVVLGAQDEDSEKSAVPVIEDMAKKNKSMLYHAENIFRIKKVSANKSLQRVHFETNVLNTVKRFYIDSNAIGYHQAVNLQTALCAVFILSERFPEIDFDKICNSRLFIYVPGRCEVINNSPLVIADGAHCALSALALCRTVKENFADKEPFFLLGVLGDKNLKEIIENLAKFWNSPPKMAIFAPQSKRASDPEKVRELAEGKFRIVGVYSNIEEAFFRAAKLFDSEKEMMVITGSLYNISPAKDLMKFFIKTT